MFWFVNGGIIYIQTWFKKKYGIYYACCFGILILYTPSVIYLEDNYYNLYGQFILTDILMSKK